MIKKLWAILLSIAIVLTMMPAMAFAGGTETYDLWVGGIKVTSENADDIFDNGTASYDAASNTLALNGTDIDQAYTSSDYYTSGIYADGDININLTGDNSINVSGGMIAAGIHANGVIRISGSGSLDLTVRDGSSETRAIATGYTDKEAGVIIDSGEISIDADGESGIYAVYVDGSYGTELPDRYLKINGGTIEMDANSTSPYSCYATNVKPNLGNYEGYSATAILNSWEVLQSYNENSWGYYRYIKVQPLEYDENGISEDKEHYQPAVQSEDGYYEIKNAGNLFWFAEKLGESDDNAALNARLVSNITMPEGMNWLAMKAGTYGTPYNGTFDGAGYTISNLSAELESGVYSNEGLFKTIGENGTVKNLGLINASIKPGSGGAGAICGTNHGLIENCYNLGGDISIVSIYGGGIAGENDGTIRQCYNTGNVESTFTYGSSIGGIAGYCHDGGKIIDCYNTGDITGAWYVGGICGELNGGTVKNCYGTGTAAATYPGYGSTANSIVGGCLGSCTVENTYYVSEKENNGGGKTSEQFSSGEVAYLLNAGRDENVWGQTIGTENAPVFNGQAVYAGYEYCYSDSITYSNDSSKVHETKPGHNFTKSEYDATSHWYSCINDGCTAINGKENHNGGQATYFKKAVCQVCNQEYGDVLKDETAPAGEISIGTNKWDKFLNDITFGLFFKDTQKVEITATDDSYNHDGYTDDKKVKIEYYIHTQDTALTEEELENETFTSYSESFSINPDNQYVIYAKITDHAGNVTYISSEGLVLDETAPVIDGITDDSIYYTTRNVTVTDDNMATVTLNGAADDENITLTGNIAQTYTIIATDKAGNETEYTVTMKPIASLAEPISDIKADNVTSEDITDIESVKSAVEAVDTENATEDEKEAIKAIADDCIDLLNKIEETSRKMSELAEGTGSISSETVKSDDRDTVNDLLEKAEGLLESGNLTETERKTVTAQKENCKNLLEIIEEVEGEITSLEDSVSRLDIDTVNSENEDTVNDLLERVNNLLKGDNLTDEEAAAMQAVQEKAGKLREKLEEAAMAGATENIEKVENIDWGNVTEKNKDDLTAAREDLENALKNYSGNYTEEEKNTLEEKLERVNGALDSIAKAETVEGAIAELPDTVKPDDTDAEKLISQAKKQYDALTEHEKNLVSGEAKEKLKRLLKEIADYQIIKGDGSKWTMGDKDPVTMVANGAYSKFTGIQVDGKDVETSYYTAKSGSTVISLKPEYLSTLSLGQHTLTVLYTDGQTSGQFEIIADSKDNSPKTGDKNNTLLWTFLMIAAACGAAGMTYRCYNRKCSK